jgi:hypothetical protein
MLRLLSEDKAMRERFEENLFPRYYRKGEKSPGDVILRLEKAGCPLRILIQCLFGYVIGSDEMRTGVRELRCIRREEARIEREAVAIGFERLLNRIEYAQVTRRDSTWIEEAEGAKAKIREEISHLRGIRNPRRYARPLRRLGHQPLEWLAVLQCFAKCVSSPLTEGELAALVWAAVSAMHPKAKRIETDTLAQAMRRFHKRNPGLRKLLNGCVSEILARYQTAPPQPPR